MSNNRNPLLAIVAFIFSNILFFLPGSSIPTGDWLDKIWADKWVHIGIFTVLVFLWSRALQITALGGLVIILIVSLLYGFSIEIIQDKFIRNRSFDLRDIIADFIGSVIGVLIWCWYKKNKPL